MQIVIKISDETYDKVVNPDNWYNPNTAIKDIVNAIKNGKALEQVPRKGHWICDGNLPDKNGLYLVTYDYKPANHHEVIIARFHIPENEDDEFRWYDETGIEITLAVTAWMPLPKPYREVEE